MKESIERDHGIEIEDDAITPVIDGLFDQFLAPDDEGIEKIDYPDGG